MDATVMEFLASLGFNLMSISNNHAWDLGDCGVAATRAAAEANGVNYAGAGPNLAAATPPRLLLMLPPRYEPPVYRVAVEEELMRVVGELAGEERLTLKILDCRNLEGITKEHFWSVGHVNRKGAVLVSQHMASLYRRGNL